MNRTRFAAPLALVLTLLLALLPLAALAAPIAQEADEPLVFMSDVLPSASTQGRILTLTLQRDGTGTLATDYLNDDEPVIENAEWVTDEVEQSLTVTITGQDEVLYEAPIVLVFAVGPDGTVTLDEWDRAIYGAEGFTLAVVTEGAAAATPAATAEAAAEEPAAEVTPAVTAEPAEEVVEIDETLAGVYVSDELAVASSPERALTLTLEADGTAALSSDFLNGELPVEELGDWQSSAAAGTITLTLTGTDALVYDEANVILFELQADGALVAVEYDETLYDSAGLTLVPQSAAEAADEGAGGVYVSDVLPTADTPGQVVFAILYEDGTVQANSYFLNGEAPIMEVGTWQEEAATSAVTMIITGSDAGDYDQPQIFNFVRRNNSLSYQGLTLNRIPAAEIAPAPEPMGYFQSEELPAASSPGLQYSLVFMDDNSVFLVSDYLNDEAPIVEMGSWEDNDDSTWTVSLTGTADRDYEVADIITFALSADETTLTAVEWDETVYGSEPLLLTESPLDELDLDALTGSAPAAEAADAEVTPEATPEPAAEVTPEPTEEPTEEPTGEPTEEPVALPEFEVPDSAIAVFATGVMPAASSPGLVMRMVLFADNTLQMVSDYLNGEAAVIELGNWVDNGDGTLDVEILGRPLGLYDEPVNITFTVSDDGSLVATDYPLEIYGSEGLQMDVEFVAQ